MPRLLLTIVVTVVAFSIVLTVVGASVGPPELAIWFVLLLGAIFAEVVVYRRRQAATGSR